MLIYQTAIVIDLKTRYVMMEDIFEVSDDHFWHVLEKFNFH